MHSSSRSKPIIDRGPEGNQPDVPILETEDLPSNDDWDLTKPLSANQDDDYDMELDAEQITIVSGDLD